MAIKSLQHSSLTDNIFYRSMLAGNTAYEPSDEDILAEEVLTSSQASVTFSSLDTLASDYQHLQVRAVTRNARTVGGHERINLTFNSDTGNNYATHRLRGTGSSVSSLATTSTDKMYVGFSPREASGSEFSANVIDILDFSSTNKNTTVRALGGTHSPSDYRIALFSGVWLNTSAVTSMTFTDDGGDNFQAGSRFTLIGLK